MNTGSALALGILAGIMIAAWILSRKNKKTAEYDEMQERIRGKAYQLGFFTGLILLVILILLLEMNAITVISPSLAVYTVMLISLAVFVIYCIVHDAFLGVNEKAKRYIIMFSILVLLEGATTARTLTDESPLENGQLSFSNGYSIVMGLCFLAILITLIVKTILNRKEAEE